MLVCSWIIWSKFDTSKNVSHIFNNYFPVSSLLFEPLPSRYHVPSLAWKNFFFKKKNTRVSIKSFKIKIKYINNFPRWKNQCTCKKLYHIALISKLYQNSNWSGGERVSEGDFQSKSFVKYRLGLGNQTLRTQFLKAEQTDSVFDVSSTSSLLEGPGAHWLTLVNDFKTIFT